MTVLRILIAHSVIALPALGALGGLVMVRNVRDDAKHYRCNVCNVRDDDHRFMACDGGEWVPA